MHNHSIMHRQLENYVDKIRLLFRKDKEPFLKLYDIMGFYPHDISIYNVALMHRSLRQPGRGNKVVNNERLEFLGDALLSAVVADVLYERFQGQQEGFLTTLRSKIVKRETLNELAVNIGLDKLVRHSDRIGTAHNSYMNGNAFEAFFAAIYLDRGYDYCMRFMKERIFTKYIDIDKMSNKEENFKSKLIEWCQHYQCKFDFVVTAEKMEDGNAPKFYSEAVIEGIVCGKGTGYSKKESHQQAAQSAYKKVRSNVGFVNKLIETRNSRVNGTRKTDPATPAKPADKPTTKPADKPTTKPADKPVEKQPKPVEKQPKPAEKQPKPVEKQPKPVEKQSKPTDKASQPTDKPANQAADRPARPAEKPSNQPADKPSKPVEKPTKLAEPAASSTGDKPAKPAERRRRPASRRPRPNADNAEKMQQTQ